MLVRALMRATHPRGLSHERISKSDFAVKKCLILGRVRRQKTCSFAYFNDAILTNPF